MLRISSGEIKLLFGKLLEFNSSICLIGKGVVQPDGEMAGYFLKAA